MKTLAPLLVIAAVFSWTSALGCSCGPRVVENQFAGSTVVFRAWLVTVDRPDDSLILDASFYFDLRESLIGQFEVIEVFKGAPANLKFVYTRDNDGACGVPFEPGTEYVFFADENGYVRLCGGTFWRGLGTTESRYEQFLDEVRTAKETAP